MRETHTHTHKALDQSVGSNLRKERLSDSPEVEEVDLDRSLSKKYNYDAKIPHYITVIQT